MNGSTRPPALCAGEAPDEKLKINELGSNSDRGAGVEMKVDGNGSISRGLCKLWDWCLSNL